MIETRDPKHLIGAYVKNEEYRSWIHKTQRCYCGASLSNQTGWLHHDAHSGSKYKPRDQLLTRFCSQPRDNAVGGCHGEIHASFNNQEALYRRFGLTEESVREDCAKMLFDYAVEKFGANAVINQLTEFLR